MDGIGVFVKVCVKVGIGSCVWVEVAVDSDEGCVSVDTGDSVSVGAGDSVSVGAGDSVSVGTDTWVAVAVEAAMAARHNTFPLLRDAYFGINLVGQVTIIISPGCIATASTNGWFAVGVAVGVAVAVGIGVGVAPPFLNFAGLHNTLNFV